MLSITSSLIGVGQAVLLVLIAPLLSGVTRKLRAKMHNRQGASIFQDYYDLKKLLQREDLRPKDTGIVFRAMPFIFFGTMFAIAIAIPMFTRMSGLPALADIITIIYLMALHRFFFALAGIDSASSFSGAGSIRELIMGTLIEPTIILSLVVVALITGTSNIAVMGQAVSVGAISHPVALVVAGIAFAIAIYFELGKLPYDVAEAEQELQEGPLTEYSGPSLALLKISMPMRQIILVSWFFSIFIPWGSAVELTVPAVLLGIVAWLVKVFVIFFLVGLIENSVSRVRFKYVGRQSWVAVGFAVLAFAFYLVGM